MKFKLSVLIILLSLKIFAQNSIQDIDGNTYQIILVDSTEWFLENLKTTRFSNGDSIPTTKNSHSILTNNTNSIFRWAPGGDTERTKNQGYLYTWGCAVDNRGICPTGWKVPSNIEWKALVDKIYTETNSYLVTDNDNANFIYKKINQSSEIPYMKILQYPGGRMISGNYIFQQSFAYFWTTTLDYKGFAWMWYFSPTNINHYNFEVNGGLSVRCMRTSLK